MFIDTEYYCPYFRLSNDAYAAHINAGSWETRFGPMVPTFEDLERAKAMMVPNKRRWQLFLLLSSEDGGRAANGKKSVRVSIYPFCFCLRSDQRVTFAFGKLQLIESSDASSVGDLLMQTMDAYRKGLTE